MLSVFIREPQFQGQTKDRLSNPEAQRLVENTLGERVPEMPTVEGVFDALSPEKRRRLADALAAHVRQAVAGRIGLRLALAVVLVNMTGDILGTDGDLTPWQQ